MENRTKCMNVVNKHGEVVVKIFLQPGDEFLIDYKALKDANRTGNGGVKGKGGNGNGSLEKTEGLMTFPQKRLLFRLLADKGVEGDKAHEHLLKAFQVSSLKEASKNEASRLIERLLKEAKGDSHA
ncbi:MAG: hypothetical protein QY316_12970 [Thermodesulfobacteriota bacterium]|nr:MAG: hypothetical protein QY316_12970 [Thermodesulfobacteriota bacterium]